MSSASIPKPKRSAVTRKGSADELAALRALHSASHLEPIPQSFYGTSEVSSSSTTSHAPAPISKTPPKPKKEPRIPAAVPKTPLQLVGLTPNMRRRESEDLPEEIHQTLDSLSPIFSKYQTNQEGIESNNPYRTDTVIYTPQSSRRFYRFIDKTYKSFRLTDRLVGDFDKEACATLKSKRAEASKPEAFPYQQFIREYIRNASPYRGILVYHGLGSGKTCASIAAAEALYGTSNKKIIVMTPASLQGNYISEISFCGFRHYSLYNHWVKKSLISEKGATYLYANTVLSLPEDYLKSILRRPEEERKVIWIPDFEQPSNYNDLTSQEQTDIREQINKSITSRITFINYNSPNLLRKLTEIACTVDENGDRLIDNAVIVIDEIHNISRGMQGTIDKYLINSQSKQGQDSRKGVKISSFFEEVVPGKWKPKHCMEPSKYKRSFLLYRLLSDARNSKIIGLSGTPLINFPEELGILSNLLGGYIECAECTIQQTDPKILEKIRAIAETEPRIDVIRFETLQMRTKVLLSVFNEGYKRAPAESSTESYVGVMYDEDAQDGIQTVFGRIQEKWQAMGVVIQDPKFVSYPRLPFDAETFREKFIHPQNNTIMNKMTLQKRLTGLISYYKEKTEYMPRVAKDQLVPCEMSDHALSVYVSARKFEMALEMEKPKGQQESGDENALLAMFSKQKDSSNYRFRSRAACNFAFPKGITRPHMSTIKRDAKKGLKQEDIDSGFTDVQDVYDEAPQGMTEEDEENIAMNKKEELEEEEEEKELVQSGGFFLGSEEEEDQEEEEEDQEEEEEDQEEEDQEEEDQEEEDQEEDQKVEMEGGAGDEEKSKRILERRAARLAEAASSSTASSTPSTSSTSRRIIRSTPASTSIAAPSVGSEPSSASVSSVAASSVATSSVASSNTVPSSGKRRIIRSKQKEPAISMEELTAPSKVSFASSTKESGIKESEKADMFSGLDPRIFRQSEEKKDIDEIRDDPAEYIRRLQHAMQQLDQQRDQYLKLDAASLVNRLSNYSTKLDQILRNMERSKGSNLVYSQFKTVEGLGVLGIALRANGYVEIRLEGPDNDLRFSKETEESLKKGPAAMEKRFILFTGEGSKEKRDVILNIFNAKFNKLPNQLRSVLENANYSNNNRGEICWTIAITGAGAEGISLRCCRSVHIMEPYWNTVRLDQVKGRAIRICSHEDLPYEERDVEIYTYYSVFSKQQLETPDAIDFSIRTIDKNVTSDERVLNVSKRKDAINHAMLQLMQEAAVDCGLNAADNGAVQCFRMGDDTEAPDRPDVYMFDPQIDVDIQNTVAEFGQDQEIRSAKEDESKKGPSAKAASAAASVSAPSNQEVGVHMIQFKGVIYGVHPKPGSGGMIYQLFVEDDIRTRFHAMGEGELDPIHPRFKLRNLYLYGSKQSA